MDTRQLQQSKRVQDVIELVQENHWWQKVRNGEPYINHLKMTAELAVQIAEELSMAQVSNMLNSAEDLYNCGYLHDSIEDTHVSFDEILDVAGEKVADWVSVLTEDKRLPKSISLPLYAKSIGTANLEIRVVKLADMLSNLRMLTGIEGSKHIQKFLNEVEQMLVHLGNDFDSIDSLKEVRKLKEQWKKKVE